MLVVSRLQDGASASSKPVGFVVVSFIAIQLNDCAIVQPPAFGSRKFESFPLVMSAYMQLSCNSLWFGHECPLFAHRLLRPDRGRFRRRRAIISLGENDAFADANFDEWCRGIDVGIAMLHLLPHATETLGSPSKASGMGVDRLGGDVFDGEIVSHTRSQRSRLRTTKTGQVHRRMLRSLSLWAPSLA